MKKKNFYEKKTICRCNGKLILMCYQFSRVLYYALQNYFRPGQECASCDQIVALG